MNTSSVNICTYCYQPRAFALGWHGCEQSMEAQSKLAGHVEAIVAIGTNQPRTSEPWDPGRPQRFQDLTQSIKISGGEIRREN